MKADIGNMRRLAVIVTLGLAAACAERRADSTALRGVPPAPAPPPPPPQPPPTATAAPTPALDPASAATLVLPIPARAQSREAPKAGWCGETAIQEGLLHLGGWAPQRLINKAGSPAHPDLYSPEIPVALTELGVRYTVYSAGKGFPSFARWARAALEEGDPVLAGVKILPTEHPEWGLDHFVLVVGHGDQGLLVNTTWGTRQWVADTTTPGLSLKNAFYGLRLTGLSLPSGAIPARLTLLQEDDDAVKLRVTCRGLRPGAVYRMQRRGRRSDDRILWTENVTAAAEHVERELTIDADQPSRFSCAPASD